jgi:hypothetical protein
LGRGLTAQALLEGSKEEEVRVVTNGEIARELLGKGWEIRYRGGNSVCATPSDLDLIVADAPRAPSGEGSPSRYSIATWHSVQDGPPEEQPGPIFDLYDAERSVAARVRRVPTPKQAAELLERYGVPGSEARNTAAS